jgi:hypothetical protein
LVSLAGGDRGEASDHVSAAQVQELQDSSQASFGWSTPRSEGQQENVGPVAGDYSWPRIDVKSTDRFAIGPDDVSGGCFDAFGPNQERVAVLAAPGREEPVGVTHGDPGRSHDVVHVRDLALIRNGCAQTLLLEKTREFEKIVLETLPYDGISGIRLLGSDFSPVPHEPVLLDLDQLVAVLIGKQPPLLIPWISELQRELNRRRRESKPFDRWRYQGCGLHFWKPSSHPIGPESDDFGRPNPKQRIELHPQRHLDDWWFVEFWEIVLKAHRPSLLRQGQLVTPRRPTTGTVDARTAQ